MTEAFYINNKDEIIVLTITKHAKDRFAQRWPVAFPLEGIPNDINLAITNFFNNAIRHQDFSRKEKTRLRRYGKDTLFFKHYQFTFVVKDAKIITVELNHKNLRCFNKRSLTSPMKHPEEDPQKSQKTHKLLRLLANTLDRDGLPKFLNLGSFHLPKEYCIENKLNNNSDFIIYLKLKLTEKKTKWISNN